VQAPGQVQPGSGEGSEGSGEGLGGFGAETGHVQQGSGEGSAEDVWEALVQSQVRFNRVPEKVPQKMSGRLWCRARSGSTGFRRFRGRFQEALVQSQVRFNRVPEKVPGEGPGGFGAEPGQEGSGEGSGEPLVQSQVRFNRVPEKVPEKVWEALVRSQVNRICGHLIHGNPVDVFPALGFAARFKKICKNKTLRLLGISPKLIVL